MGKHCYFRAYNLNNQLVYEANNQSELARMVGVSKSMISYVIRKDTLLNNELRIEKEEKDVAKKINKVEKNIDYLYRHMKHYGNTCFTNDASEYVEALKEKGIEFKARKVRDGVGKKRGRPKYFYILETIK